MDRLQKLPIGLQNFEKLRRGGYLYVDKTEQVYRLVSEGCYYFLSRPRRFGKSMLISTLKAFYEGKRELFDGTIGQRLAIADKADVRWEAYPVLHLDLNTNKYDAPEVLQKKFDESLAEWEDLYSIPRKDLPLGMRFEKVIQAAYRRTGRRVVILVDEYDKPMLQALENETLQKEYRDTLKGFYGALKSMDGCIEFALLTGVTKFGKVSVFSDLNNLIDLSMERVFYDVCGITGQELLSVFAPYIDALAGANGMTKEACVARLRERYDGYHFHQDAPGMYNPYSVLNTFRTNEFGSYWFETGTPSYLVKLLQRFDMNLSEMSRCRTTSKVLDSVDPDSRSPIPVIYQSGYLTIKGYQPLTRLYTLGFPNEEVAEGFIDYLMPYYTSVSEVDSAFRISQFVEDVERGDTDAFVRRLRSLFADVPYEIVKNRENHYRNVIWIVAKLMGFYVEAEYRTSEGRIDLVLKAPRYCYVMEFKLDGTAEEALRQIRDKSYTLPFEMNGQQIIRVGMNFSSETRNIERYVVE